MKNKRNSQVRAAVRPVIEAMEPRTMLTTVSIAAGGSTTVDEVTGVMEVDVTVSGLPSGHTGVYARFDQEYLSTDSSDMIDFTGNGGYAPVWHWCPAGTSTVLMASAGADYLLEDSETVKVKLLTDNLNSPSTYTVGSGSEVTFTIDDVDYTFEQTGGTPEVTLAGRERTLTFKTVDSAAIPSATSRGSSPARAAPAR